MFFKQSQHVGFISSILPAGHKQHARTQKADVGVVGTGFFKCRLQGFFIRLYQVIHPRTALARTPSFEGKNLFAVVVKIGIFVLFKRRNLLKLLRDGFDSFCAARLGDPRVKTRVTRSMFAPLFQHCFHKSRDKKGRDTAAFDGKRTAKPCDVATRNHVVRRVRIPLVARHFAKKPKVSHKVLATTVRTTREVDFKPI